MIRKVLFTTLVGSLLFVGYVQANPCSTILESKDQVLVDATLNGFAKDAPTEFASPEAAVEIIRNVQNILHSIFPNSPVFIAGRSHGGLIAIEYAHRYGTVDAVIAVNPTPSDLELHERSFLTSTKNAQSVVADTPIELNRSWDAYGRYAGTFIGFGTDPVTSFIARLFFGKRKSIPTLLLLGSQDPSYPQPDYINYAQKFAKKTGFQVKVIESEPGLSHDLWSRRDKKQFRNVLESMVDFIQKSILQ